jgi:enamine deaminase RidA (YjgF/YER057c/UK114 family)
LDRPVSDSPHKLVNPPTLPDAVGFSHAVVAAPGRTVYLGGQGPLALDGSIAGETMLEQFDLTAENVVKALEGAGARPEHLVSLQIFVTDTEEYRASLAEIGRSYRRHFGRHYPALALFEVTRLMDEAAKVELMGIAVVPE